MNTVLKLARLSVAALLLALGLAHPTAVAHATAGATLTVNSNLDVDAVDGVCTLREAIIAAANNADYHGCVNSAGTGYGDDIIRFSIASSTTITLSATLPIIFPGSGSLTINGSNGGRPVVIDGASAHQVFNVSSGGTLTLGGLTVQHGSAGLDGSGGGVDNSGTLIVLRSTFRNNTAGSDGGAIVNWATLNVSNSSFYGNSSHYGGAIENNSGTATIYNSTFSGNTASANGGALATYKGGALNPITRIYNTIMANSTPEDCFRWDTGTMTGSNNIIETTTGAGGGPDCSGVTTSTADPRLGVATGSPAYFPLNAGSPAIDTGNNTTCANAPVLNTSLNGIPRPQDGNNDGVRTCDIGSYEKPVTFNARSQSTLDGWVLESTETSGLGGSKLATGNLRVGDDVSDRQYRSILSFSTGLLPDTAVIQNVTLRVKRYGVVGTLNPVTALQGFQPAVQRGFFGTASGLENGDFQFTTTATKTVGPFTPTLVSGWYTLDLTNAKAYVNKLSTVGSGLTQIRLRFKLDDNDNLTANILSLYAGDATNAGDQPLLTVTYYMP